MAFGDQLRQLRVARGYSLTDLSRLVYYSKGHLSKIENGRHVPHLEHAWQLDIVLNAGGTLVSELPGYPRGAGGEPDGPRPPPSGLPHQPPRFVGRERELAILKAQLCAGPATPRRPVACVIDGLPGAGKTTVAARVASELAPRFPDGVLFLDLHGYTGGNTPPLTPAEALGRLLRRLDLPVPDELDERAARWRGHLAERRFLIVADNALRADQVRALIPPTAASRLLVTSRALLAPLDGAFTLSLGPLAQAEAEFLLTSLTGADEADADLADAGPRGAIADIVRACGRLPLALTIAAARLRAGTRPDDLRDALTGAADPLAEITDGERSLAAAFGASYQALPPDVRGTFARLGLHQGEDWTADQVMALDGLDRPAALRRIERLIAARFAEPDANGRLRCHDLVRSYARQLAAELPADAARWAVESLVTWAVDMTARADALIEPHRYHPPVRPSPHARPFSGAAASRAASDWLRAEHGNLVALCGTAYEWCLDEQCWQLAYFLRSYFFLTKQYDDWVATHAVALAAARRAGATAAEAMTRNNLGVALTDLGRLKAADEQFSAVLALPAASELQYARATARAHRSWVLHAQGEWAQAVREGEAAWRFYTDHAMDRNAAITRRGTALAEVKLGHFAEAIAHLEESLATFTRLGLELNAAMAQNCLGEACLSMGDAAAAERWAASAARAARECHSTHEEARSLRLLGEIAFGRGDKEAALGCWASALDHYALLRAPEEAEVSARIALCQ
jgi:transcriptional regulator with XRE-family HTH domain/tetratricopeptide (TPR) repeat protein